MTAFFKVKVGDTIYELDKLTLGEARRLKRDFGLTNLEEFSGTDPDQLVGLLFLALKRAHPERSDADLVAEVEGLDIEAFQPQEDEPDPTPPATDAPAAEPVEPALERSGAPETSPETPGDLSTDGFTD